MADDWIPPADALSRAWKEIARPWQFRLEEQVAAMGWVPAERLQELLKNKPEGVPLGAYLVAQKAITPEQLAEVLGPQPFYFCSSCLRRFDVEGAQAGVRYRCPYCRTPLLPQAGEGTMAAEALEVHAEELPEEARDAARAPEMSFDKYVKIRFLGRGGMGSVWRGYDRELKRFVALKFLEGAGEATVERFFREAKVAARLEHPNIARVYDSGSWRGAPFLVMQFVEGKTLAAPLPVREAAGWIAQAAGALHYAHERGVIHRDVKPDNIMLTPEGNVIVLDFGLARELDVGSSISVPGAVMGTPPFMSPEQILGENHRVDARSDVYALGATLFAVLTGRPPFPGETFAEVMRRVVTEDPPKPSRLRGDLPWDIDVIIGKALEKDPARRYPSAKEFGEDLKRYLEGRPILARPAGWLHRVQKLAKRHAAAAASLSVFALAAILAGTFWLGLYVQRRGELGRLLEDGKQKLERGDLEGSHEALVRAAEIDPAAAEPTLRRAQEGLQRLAEHERERTAVDPLVRRLREIQWTARPMNYAGVLDELMSRGGALAAAHPDWAGAWLVVGWAKRGRARYGGKAKLADEALADLTRAVERSEAGAPTYRADAHYQRGLSQADLAMRKLPVIRRPNQPGGDKPKLNAETQALIDGALADLQAYRRAAPQDVGRTFGEALVAYLQGDYDGVIERLNRPDAPGTIEELVLQARAYFFAKGDRRLQKDVEFVAERTRRPEILHLVGLMRMAAGHFEDAENVFTEALRADPENAVRWLTRGVVRGERGNFKEAVEDYTKAIELDPEMESAYLQRGLARLRLGAMAEAGEDFSWCLRRNPQNAEALLGRATVDEAIAETNPSQAVALLRQAEQDLEAALEAGGKEWPKASQARTRLNRVRDRRRRLSGEY